MKHKKLMLLLIAGLIIVTLVGFVSALEFDNTYIFDDKAGDYGTVTIKDWFGILSLETIELKTNTEICDVDNNCEAVKEIVMFQRGTLIDEVRFIDLKDGEYTTIKDYQFYIKDGEKLVPYTLDEEVEEGTYEVVLVGEIKPFQKVDWQIKSQGFWIEDWAVWQSHLNVQLKLFYSFNENSGTKAEEIVNGDFNLTVNNTWDASGILGSAYNTSKHRTNSSFRPTSNGGTDNFTINYWIKRTGSWGGINQYPIYSLNYSPNANGKDFMGGTTNGLLVRNSWDDTSNKVLDKSGILILNTWYMITALIKSNNVSIYFNGEPNQSIALSNWEVGSQALYLFGNNAGTNNVTNMSIDEFGYWNRQLNDTEIDMLYNSGSATSYSAQISTTLNSPIDGFSTTNRNVTFNCSSSSLNNLENVTLYHNGTGTFGANQTRVLTGTINSSNFISPFSDFEKYTWNCLTCDDTNDCDWGDSNFTFRRSPITIDAEYWHNATTEGASETFYINISTVPGSQISTATLDYNNTNYLGTLTRNGDSYEIEKTITVDGVIADVNLTFNWTLLLDDSSIEYSNNHNQSVVALSIDNCDTNSVEIMNLTVYDENSQIKFNASFFNSTMEIDVNIFSKGNSNQVLNFSGNFTKNESVSVCINANLSQTSYDMDAQVKYDADSYAPEFYNIQNFSLTNTSIPQNISLYDLLDANAQAFKITFKDENFIAVTNALIQVQRKYIGDGVFRTVEQPETDYKGETLAQLQINEAIYTFIVSKNGEILGTFNELIAVCQNPALDPCEINLNSFGTSIEPADYTIGDDFSFTLEYNKTSREIESIFSVPSGATATILLNATLYDNIGVTSACSDKLISSAGTLTCTVPIALGNGTVIVKIIKDGNEAAEAFIDLRREPGDLYGLNIVFLSLFLMLTMIGIGISDSPVITGVFILIGAVLLIALNLIDTGTSSFIGAGATILWLFIAVILVIIKGAKRT